MISSNQNEMVKFLGSILLLIEIDLSLKKYCISKKIKKKFTLNQNLYGSCKLVTR